MLAYSFWGAEHILFGADMPLGDPAFGANSYRETISAIEAMDIPEAEKQMIFGGNVAKLLRLGT
jgi:predicted TIM-barrel fold metal-dependent hydrolase